MRRPGLPVRWAKVKAARRRLQHTGCMSTTHDLPARTCELCGQPAAYIVMTHHEMSADLMVDVCRIQVGEAVGRLLAQVEQTEPKLELVVARLEVDLP